MGIDLLHPFMCHRQEQYRKKPKSWRPIHLECPKCFGPKVVCSFLVGSAPPLKIWICRPCHNAQPSIRDIIESNSMKYPL